MSRTAAAEKEDLWRVREVAQYLGFPISSIYRMTASKTIPHCKIGGGLRFRPSTIVRWLEGLEEGPGGRPLPARRRKGGR